LGVGIPVERRAADRLRLGDAVGVDLADSGGNQVDVSGVDIFGVVVGEAVSDLPRVVTDGGETAAMFDVIFDQLSYLGSWRWPVAEGEITDVLLDRDEDDWRVSITYKFSVGEDGPYTGESFWKPTFSWNAAKQLRSARRILRTGRAVQVRYREDDPSVNRLDVEKVLKR
jgi:hypothetical protein